MTAMRRLLPFIAIAVVLSASAPLFAQEWMEFTSKEDRFKVKFPGQPKIAEKTYKSEYEVDLPTHVYSAAQGQTRYSLTVVDYNQSQPILTARAKECAQNLERCNGRTAYSGAGYWKNDVRGALIYASWQAMRRDATLTQYRWTTVADRTEAYQLELINKADQSRTITTISMYANRLYIMESTGSADSPQPDVFQSSLMFLDDRGNLVFHEGVYFNGARVDRNETAAGAGGEMPETSASEEWKEFTSTADFFTANFPGQPVVTETPWKSEYGAYLPAHAYTVKKGPAVYSMTVVDYNLGKPILAEAAKRCAPNPERCGELKGGGGEAWKTDVRGAMVYAAFRIMQRDVMVTHYMWNYLGHGPEGHELQLLNNADKSRTFVTLYMHNNRLYIMEATVPGNYPAPGLFTESVSLLEKDGSWGRHEGVYFNGARLDPYEIETGVEHEH